MKMKKNRNKSIFNTGVIACVVLMFTACSLPNVGRRIENRNVPLSYAGSMDTLNAASTKWRDFFKDPNLIALIDTALKNNQELNILNQDIFISENEIRARKGAYLPFLDGGAAVGVDKSSKYTSTGANDDQVQVLPGKFLPNPLQNYLLVVNASWEVDIWKKLRNAKKAAVYRYLSSNEGKNFLITQLIAEIADSYYEVMALDNQLEILRSNIDIQQNALSIVQLEKQAARVTELAVRKFEAEVLKNQSRQYDILQQIKVTENRINFLVGRFPQDVTRSSNGFSDMVIDSVSAGIPTQLLRLRPDIRQAEQDLIAAKLDVNVARAEFYPSLTINANAGYSAFNPKYLTLTPEALIFSLAGNLVAPLINRNAIKANYYSANSRQIQAVYNYERAILTAHIEVVNQLSNAINLSKSYDLRQKQVSALNQSIDISGVLFKSARADYMEVLLTQRDALEAKFELIETKRRQMSARINIYKALGGGWR
jgi:outer membrane protein, multidrug efflux system